MFVFIGMETSGQLRRAFQALGHETYSCDLLPADDGGEEMAESEEGLPLGRHMRGDVFETIDHFRANDMIPDIGIFHPDCTYLTNSAAWAFNDPDYGRYPGIGYHQRVKAGTLTGRARREARFKALCQIRAIAGLPFRTIVENPIGAINSTFGPASQIVQPYQFGDDASKATCLWDFDERGNLIPRPIIPIDPSKRCNGRMVDDNGTMRERWANQTDKGQNRLTPSDDRWKDRARTYDGIAKALAKAISDAVDRRD